MDVMNAPARQRQSQDRRRSAWWRPEARLLVILAAFALLAACGSTAGGEAADATDAGGADGDQVEITLWAGRDYFIPEDNFAKFHEEHPNIRVNADVVSLDEVFQDLGRMRDAGQPLPDIVHTDGQIKAAMWEAGFVRDISDVVARWEEEDPEGYGMIYDSVWADGTWDDKQIAMADTGTMDMLFYRKDWFEEAGYDQEFESWDEFLEALRTIKAERPDVVPFSVPAARREGQDAVFMQMSAMGVEFENGIPQLQSESGLYFIEFYQTLSREGLVSPDAIAWTQEDARGAFQGNRAAAASDGWGQIDELATAGLEYGEQVIGSAFPTSLHGGTEDGQIVGFAKNWFITAESEHPYEASLVFRYLMDPEIVVAQAINGQIARHEAVLAEDSELFEAVPAMSDFVDEISNAEEFSTDTNYPQVTEALERMLQDMLQNPDEAPEALAERWQAEFDALAPS